VPKFRRRKDADEMQAIARRILESPNSKAVASLTFKTEGAATNFIMRFNMWRRDKVDKEGLDLYDAANNLTLVDYELLSVTRSENIALIRRGAAMSSSLSAFEIDGEPVALSEVQKEVEQIRKERIEAEQADDQAEEEILQEIFELNHLDIGD
jgi:hypothetical protein